MIVVDAAPPATTADVRDRIRDAAAAGTTLRITAGGRWLAAGRPVAAAATLPLAALAGIIDYIPGDLTLTAHAGTTLGTIARVTAAERQWLAMDPFGGDDGTLGASVATASAGPVAHAFGLPRDNVLGLEFVTGAGAIARGGGRVVKNVAGFDLARLLIGSWGTLGAITEVTVRLRALPEADLSLAFPVPDDAGALREMLAQLRRAPLAAWAIELVNAPLARHLGLEPATHLLVRLGGNAALVAAQQATLAGIGDTVEQPAEVWDRLRGCEPDDAAVARLSRPPASIADTWLDAITLVRPLGLVAPNAPPLVHASLGRGVVRCICPAVDEEMLAAAFRSSSFGGTVVFERLPPRLWNTLAASPVGDRLSRGVRRAYDPHRILNPGILGDEDR